MVSNVLQIVWLVAAVGLVILVMLHSPKGDGLGALGGQAQMFTSTKSAETTLNRTTWTLTILFMGATVVLSGGWLETALPPATSESAPALEQPAVDVLPSDLTAPSPAPAPVSE